MADGSLTAGLFLPWVRVLAIRYQQEDPMRLLTCGALTMCAWLISVPFASAQQATGATAVPAKATINLNTATQADLESLPGVGPRMAERILEYRQKNGGFKKVEELMNVKGIGEKAFLKLKPLVAVPPKTEKAGSGG